MRLRRRSYGFRFAAFSFDGFQHVFVIAYDPKPSIFADSPALHYSRLFTCVTFGMGFGFSLTEVQPMSEQSSVVW